MISIWNNPAVQGMFVVLLLAVGSLLLGLIKKLTVLMAIAEKTEVLVNSSAAESRREIASLRAELTAERTAAVVASTVASALALQTERDKVAVEALNKAMQAAGLLSPAQVKMPIPVTMDLPVPLPVVIAEKP